MLRRLFAVFRRKQQRAGTLPTGFQGSAASFSRPSKVGVYWSLRQLAGRRKLRVIATAETLDCASAWAFRHD